MLIQAYQKSWADDFERIRAVIAPALNGKIESIEHIGSTAVPGLAAKAIIDLDVVFSPPVLFEEIKIGLESLGYLHHGDQGIIGRAVFKRDPAAQRHAILDTIPHHLYVCPEHSEELKKHLIFRNYLRMNALSRIQYEALKYAIADEAAHDKKVYARLKEIKASDFIRDILAKAQMDISNTPL